MPEEMKTFIINKLEKNNNGKLYLSILDKITYILPKAHAAAYAMTA